MVTTPQTWTIPWKFQAVTPFHPSAAGAIRGNAPAPRSQHPRLALRVGGASAPGVGVPPSPWRRGTLSRNDVLNTKNHPESLGGSGARYGGLRATRSRSWSRRPAEPQRVPPLTHRERPRRVGGGGDRLRGGQSGQRAIGGADRPHWARAAGRFPRRRPPSTWRTSTHGRARTPPGYCGWLDRWRADATTSGGRLWRRAVIASGNFAPIAVSVGGALVSTVGVAAAIVIAPAKK